MLSKRLFSLIAVVMLILLVPNFPSSAASNEKSFTPEFFSFDHYPSYEEMNATIHRMAENYSSIMKVFSIGKTWG